MRSERGWKHITRLERDGRGEGEERKENIENKREIERRREKEKMGKEGGKESLQSNCDDPDTIQQRVIHNIHACDNALMSNKISLVCRLFC